MKSLDILTCTTSVFILFLFSFVRTDDDYTNNVKLENIDKDEGQNVTLKCSSNGSSVSWIVSDDSKFVGLKPRSPNSAVLKDGSFFISDLSSSDSHLYTCQDVETNKSLRIGKSLDVKLNSWNRIPISILRKVQGS